MQYKRVYIYKGFRVQGLGCIFIKVEFTSDSLHGDGKTIMVFRGPPRSVGNFVYIGRDYER